MLARFKLKLDQAPPKGSTEIGIDETHIVWEGDDIKELDGYESGELTKEEQDTYNSWPKDQYLIDGTLVPADELSEEVKATASNLSVRS